MRAILKGLSMAAVSIFLLWAGTTIMQHQSSSAFDLGLFLCFLGLFHWVWWPKSAK